jgi:chemotaxis protein MotB
MADPMDMMDDDDEGGPTAPFWMVTFSDMATLLLTFFVMIVAMSEVEVKKFKEALSYFQGRTSVLLHDAAVPPPQTPVLDSKDRAEAEHEQIEQAVRFEELLEYLEENDLDGKVKVDMTDRGMHVIITDSVMFRSGQAQLLPDSRDILQRIAGVVRTGVEMVVVEGHTDNQPINTQRYPTNWELSGARAASVVRFLLGQETALDPARYVAVGFGEFQPVASNTFSAGRAQNRRVEILFSWEPWHSEINPLQTDTSIPRS